MGSGAKLTGLRVTDAFKVVLRGAGSRTAVLGTLLASLATFFFVLHFFYPTLGNGWKIFFTLWVAVTLVIALALAVLARASSGYYDLLLSERIGVPSHKDCHTLDSAFFGLRRKEYATRFDLTSDGAADINSTVSLVATTSNIKSVEHYRSAPHAREDGDSIGIELLKVGGDKNTGNLDIVSANSRSASFRIAFQPSLAKGDGVEYSLLEKLGPGSFAMSYDDLQRRKMEWEHCAVRITWPTAGLFMRVTFPLRYVVSEVEYDVWLGNAQVRHMDEFTRIHNASGFLDGTQNGKNCLDLRVAYPIHGLFYVLKWKPPRTTDQVLALPASKGAQGDTGPKKVS